MLQVFRPAATLALVLATGSLAAEAQPVTNLVLTSSTLSSCNFAQTDSSDGRRPIQINLKIGDSYNFGEAYGQLFFDFRRNGSPQAPQNWFTGFKQALLSSGFLSEDREYIFALGAYAAVPDANGVPKRVELGKQIAYHFRTGRGGTIELLTTQIQAGDRRVISSVEREGIFTLSPRLEIISNTNVVEIEFEFYQSKQTKVETGLIGRIVAGISSVLGLGGAITFPQQQLVSNIVEGATKPIQDIAKVLSEHFEPVERLKRVKSVGFLPGLAVSMNNVASYSAEVQEGARKSSYELRTYAAVIPSIISTSLDGDCRYPRYSEDPNSILRAAVTPGNMSIEQFYKNDSVRRVFLAQLGRQQTRSDLVESCNALKEDLRRFFGGLDGYAITWAILASRETNFADKVAARDCLTSVEKKVMYDKLKLAKLFGES